MLFLTTAHRLFVAVTVAVFILITIYYSINVFFMKRQEARIFPNSNKTVIEEDPNLCKVPDLQPYDEKVIPFLSKEAFFCSNVPQLVLSSDRYLSVNHAAFKNYNITNSTSLTCYYSPFWRVIPKLDQVDKIVKYGEKIYFQDFVLIKDEFVRVDCAVEENRVIYTDYYAFVPVIQLKREIR